MTTQGIEPSRDAHFIDVVSQWYKQVKCRRVHQVSPFGMIDPKENHFFLNETLSTALCSRMEARASDIAMRDDAPRGKHKCL
jgi:hypothetical protein